MGFAEAAESELFCTSCVQLDGPAPSSSNQYNFFSLRVVQQKRASGTVTSIGQNTVADTNADWSAIDFSAEPHYLIITSTGANEGRMTDIVGNGATTLTLSDDLSALPSPPVAGDRFEIRRHATISRLFGPNNEAGLGAGLNGNDADNVLLADPGGGIRRFFFDSGASPGWKTITFQPAGETVINPEQGIILGRKQAASLTIYMQGVAKAGPTRVPIEPGFNLVGTLKSQASVTLAALGLVTGDPVTGMASGSNANDADTLWLVDAGGQIVRYFHDGAAWMSAQFSPADSVVVEAGSAFYVKRKSESGFNWTIPGE